MRLNFSTRGRATTFGEVKAAGGREQNTVCYPMRLRETVSVNKTLPADKFSLNDILEIINTSGSPLFG